MNRFIPLVAAFGLALPQIAAADEISDTLESALKAYQDGDVQYAIEELDFARLLLLELKTDALSEYLPPAPEGWTVEVNSEINAGMAMMGGGVGAEATYTAPDGDNSFTITMMADNPMIASMSAMLANAGAMGLKTERLGRQRFMVQDGEISGVVGNRVLIQARGDDTGLIFETLEKTDFRALADFGL